MGSEGEQTNEFTMEEQEEKNKNEETLTLLQIDGVTSSTTTTATSTGNQQEETLHGILQRILTAIFSSDPNTTDSKTTLFKRIKNSVYENVPLLPQASRNSARNLLIWTRQGTSLRALLVISVGTIVSLALTGLLVFMLFFLAATINAIVISLLMSLAAAGGFLAIFFACMTAIYIGALSVALFVISSATITTIFAVLIATGWVGFFWTVWIATKKGMGLAKHSITMTGSALSAYSAARQLQINPGATKKRKHIRFSWGARFYPAGRDAICQHEELVVMNTNGQWMVPATSHAKPREQNWDLILSEKKEKVYLIVRNFIRKAKQFSRDWDLPNFEFLDKEFPLEVTEPLSLGLSTTGYLQDAVDDWINGCKRRRLSSNDSLIQMTGFSKNVCNSDDLEYSSFQSPTYLRPKDLASTANGDGLKKVAYPFDMVKPGGIKGDVTLTEINERIMMRPKRPVRHPVGDLGCSSSSCVFSTGFGPSGKVVVAITRIHTQGRGTVTIIKTRG
ncbi:voltage-dependent L-type calcium channel subunit [Thalictrum thalictroides]|uniref:Voltage-dependent L-type calcium channel subunit n=1 Tax=Thalictrum thalictroides TaxID=46969 RepID=A0A7J6VRV1_THATH|nr:voltage-dependent L-type calcium channel subunit [Thalictrum thalictroides]